MIIGITGTNGAGKGTVVDYLKTKGFTHFSARNFIAEEVVRRGLSIDRTTLGFVANSLRKEHGPTYIIEALYKAAVAAGGDAVIESIREIKGAEFLKSKGVILWGVDADRRVRYERAVLRGSHTDKVTFEEFCMQEDREMAQIEAHDMHITGVMQLADVTLTNDGTPEDLFLQVEDALKNALK